MEVFWGVLIVTALLITLLGGFIFIPVYLDWTYTPESPRKIHVVHRGKLFFPYLVSGLGFKKLVFAWPKGTLKKRIERGTCQVKKAGVAQIAHDERIAREIASGNKRSCP